MAKLFISLRSNVLQSAGLAVRESASSRACPVILEEASVDELELWIHSNRVLWKQEVRCYFLGFGVNDLTMFLRYMEELRARYELPVFLVGGVLTDEATLEEIRDLLRNFGETYLLVPICTSLDKLLSLLDAGEEVHT